MPPFPSARDDWSGLPVDDGRVATAGVIGPISGHGGDLLVVGYPFCRGLAEMAWRDNPDADGIVWSSIRDSAARAMLLCGDRLDPADFPWSRSGWQRPTRPCSTR
jgi:hypothetical protein